MAGKTTDNTAGEPAPEHAGDPVRTATGREPAATGRDPAGEPAATGRDPAAGRADLEETKRKFRAALDRKRDQHTAANADGVRGTGKVHGSHGPAQARRSFRRKSGG